MGLPSIGANLDAPFSARSSAWSSAESRTNSCFPKSPPNMFPFTKAASFPNIGRTCIRGSFGSTDWKKALSSLSGRGIFISEVPRDAHWDVGLLQVLRLLGGDLHAERSDEL